jgi:hypothetical protein
MMRPSPSGNRAFMALVPRREKFCAWKVTGYNAARVDQQDMAKAAEIAIEALRSLPERDQERMGRQLLSYIEKLLSLRQEIDKGSHALAEAAGDALDIEEFLRRQNERHGRG